MPARRTALGFALAAYAFAATMLGTTLPTPLYGLYRVKFGFSELMVTVIFATYAVGVIAALLLFGRMSDVVGRRAVLLPGLACSALSAVCFLVAGGVGWLLAGRALSGLSAGIFTGTATATLVDLAPPEGRGRATLIGTVANMAGLGCGPLLAGLVSVGFGSPLRVVFWVDLGLVAIAAAGVMLLPETVSERGRPRLVPQALHVPTEMRGAFIRAALAGFAGFAVLGLFTGVSPAFLTSELGVHSRAVVGLVVFAVFAASTAGQVAMGRVGVRRSLPAGSALLIAGMVLLGGGLGAKSLALLVVGGIVTGFGQGLSFRAALAGLNERAPDAGRAEVASAFFVVAYVAISLPVVGEGVLADVWTLQGAGLVFCGVVAVLAAVVLVLLARERD